jgi:hypothetical protein
MTTFYHYHAYPNKKPTVSLKSSVKYILLSLNVSMLCKDDVFKMKHMPISVPYWAIRVRRERERYIFNARRQKHPQLCPK